MQTFTLPAMLSRSGQLQRIASALAALPLDIGWRIEFHEDDGKRTTQQNRYLWGTVYESILKAGGNTLAGWEPEDLHEYLLGEHFGWETVTGFGKRRLRPMRRSSRLSKNEFASFLEFIQRRMAEHGIVVPDPDPNFRAHAA